jgi:hypothetical protein
VHGTLTAKVIEILDAAVMEQPEWARELLAKLTDETETTVSD